VSIRIFYDVEGVRLNGWLKLVKIIRQKVNERQYKVGDLNFIITGDSEIRSLNVKYLEHDYFTDVITFNYNEGNRVGGEIYISIDTVAINAEDYGVSVQDELKRVIIHGVLHLLGMNDITEEERKQMRTEEDKWLLLTRI